MIFCFGLAVPEFEEGGIYSKASDWYLLGLLLYELLVNEVTSLSFFHFLSFHAKTSSQFDYPGDEDLYFVASGSLLPSSVSIEASTLLQGVGLLFFLLMLRTY